MENRIREYLKQPYSRILIPDSETGRYTAQIMEFKGCFSEGSTPQRAYRNLEKAAYNWLESAIKQGMEIPTPFSVEGYSGKVALRLPKSLHRQASSIARRDGVSLNQFLVSAISAAIGAENLYERILDRMDKAIAASAVTARIAVAGVDLPHSWSVTAGMGKTLLIWEQFSRARSVLKETQESFYLGEGQSIQ